MSTATVTLSRQLRSCLEGAPDAPLASFLVQVNSFVQLNSTSPDLGSLSIQLVADLEKVHDELVDHSSLSQTEIFLATLYHLRPVLSPNSIISNWFDLVLRPALKEPRLPVVVTNYAKKLILFGLEKTSVIPDRLDAFRRRLFDLYLLDAFNEISDVLMWAELEEEKKARETCWKQNLEDILLRFGVQQPEDFMTEVKNCFMNPTSRLQLISLLNQYSSEGSFAETVSILAAHPLMTSILNSLLLDNSSTLCTTSLNLLVKLLPLIAVKSSPTLKLVLPKLLVTFARVLTWKERPAMNVPEPSPEDIEVLKREVEETGISQNLPIRPELGWERLQLTFNAMASSAPSSRQFFTILYYLFPSNVLRFLRSPAQYLNAASYESPYTVSWEDVLDEAEIRSMSERLLRTHVCHPLLLWRDAVSELSQPDFWEPYDSARIASESMMLDAKKAALGIREMYMGQHHRGSPTAVLRTPIQVQPPSVLDTSEEEEESSEAGEEASEEGEEIAEENGEDEDDDEAEIFRPQPKLTPISLSSNRPQQTLQSMITTSIALKSNLSTDILNPGTPSGQFLSATTTPLKGTITLPPEGGSSFVSIDELPSHVGQAIASLQREVFLLRNELNFELWLSKENVKHIGRLYQDRVLSKTAESERQALHNQLRKYRAEVLVLKRELADHKATSLSSKSQSSDYNSELNKRLRELREEKQAWITEAATLRQAEKETKSHFVAQGSLLDKLRNQLFELQAEKKANQHKIDRVSDYENQIELNRKMQAVWDEDFQKFNERAEAIKQMRAEYRQMKMRLETYEQLHSTLQQETSHSQARVRELEAELQLASQKLEGATESPAKAFEAFITDKNNLIKDNRSLRSLNSELRERIDQLKVSLEFRESEKR